MTLAITWISRNLITIQSTCTVKCENIILHFGNVSKQFHRQNKYLFFQLNQSEFDNNFFVRAEFWEEKEWIALVSLAEFIAELRRPERLRERGPIGTKIGKTCLEIEKRGGEPAVNFPIKEKYLSKTPLKKWWRCSSYLLGGKICELVRLKC